MPVFRGSGLGVLSQLRGGSSTPTRAERGMDRAGRGCSVARRCWDRVCTDKGRKLQQANNGTDDRGWFHLDRSHRYGADTHGDEFHPSDHDGHDNSTRDNQPHVIADHYVTVSVVGDDRSGRRQAFARPTHSDERFGLIPTVSGTSSRRRRPDCCSSIDPTARPPLFDLRVPAGRWAAAERSRTRRALTPCAAV